MNLSWLVVFCANKLIGLGNGNGIFSIKKGYLATIKDESQSVVNPSWGAFWKAKLHKQQKMHLWKLKANVLPTRSILSQRIIWGDLNYTFCEAKVEFMIHLFRVCQLACIIVLVSYWDFILDCLSNKDVNGLVAFCCYLPKEISIPGLQKNFLTMFLATLFYTSWNT